MCGKSLSSDRVPTDNEVNSQNISPDDTNNCADLAYEKKLKSWSDIFLVDTDDAIYFNANIIQFVKFLATAPPILTGLKNTALEYTKARK